MVPNKGEGKYRIRPWRAKMVPNKGEGKYGRGGEDTWIYPDDEILFSHPRQSNECSWSLLNLFHQEKLTSIDLPTRYEPNSGIKNFAKITKTMKMTGIYWTRWIIVSGAPVDHGLIFLNFPTNFEWKTSWSDLVASFQPLLWDKNDRNSETMIVFGSGI